MKNNIILLITIVLFINCSNDDDAAVPPIEEPFTFVNLSSIDFPYYTATDWSVEIIFENTELSLIHI